MTARPVVVTGLGVIGAAGAGRAALAAQLAVGAPVLREVDRAAGYHHPRAARSAALVDPAALSALVPPAAARRMSPPSRFAVAATKLALADAGLANDDALTASVVASAFGPTSFTEKLLRQILVDGPEAASPYYFTECVANAPAAQAAIAVGARGPNVTITEREAGPLLAVAEGARLVASGRAARALAGTAEEMSPLLHSVLDRFRALARAEDDGVERARPFDRHRHGLVAAEGAAILVLENESDAAARGATVLARVAGAGRAFDPTASPTGWGRGATRLGAALARTLAACGGAHTIGAIVSGASGTVAGDALEAAVLREAWSGSALPPVLAPKGTTGEYGGGHVAAAVLAAGGAPFAATAGFATADPALSIIPHAGRPLDARRVLVTAFAAGGAAAWLVLERT